MRLLEMSFSAILHKNVFFLQKLLYNMQNKSLFAGVVVIFV